MRAGPTSRLQRVNTWKNKPDYPLKFQPNTRSFSSRLLLHTSTSSHELSPHYLNPEWASTSQNFENANGGAKELKMRVLAPLLVIVVCVSSDFACAARAVRAVTRLDLQTSPPRAGPSFFKSRHKETLLSLRGGAFSVLGWSLPASSHLAKFYVGFTFVNGAAMAIVPSIAASSYGSAFDDSKGSMLATLLLERQGDAVLGTSILLYLSTFADVPLAQSVAWSAVPYVISILKSLGTGQLALLGIDTNVSVAILLSLLLPACAAIIPSGLNPTIAANILAAIVLLIGGAGTLSPVQIASVEGLDVASVGWIKGCWSMAFICILQHAILMWRVLMFGSSNDSEPYSSVAFAALLNVAVSAYIAFWSGIPEAVEIPKIAFVLWMAIGLVVGLGILGG